MNDSGRLSGRSEDALQVAQVPESVGERLGEFLVSGNEERVSKSALIRKNGIALQAVSGRCQRHVANRQHVQFQSSEIPSTTCFSYCSSGSSRSGVSYCFH